MGEKGPETDNRLNMSLDALIGQSTRGDRPARRHRGGQRNKKGGGGGNGGRGGGQQGPQQQQQRGGRGGDGLPRTNTGLVMPSFGSPPFGGGRFGGGFPDPRQFGGMPPMPPDAVHIGSNGLPMPVMPPGFFHAAFGRGQPPPPPPQQPAEPPQPSRPAAVPQARLEEESGEVTVSLKGRQILRVSRGGAITVDTNGVRGPAMFLALNAVLNTVGISITRPQKEGEWSVSDGRSLTRFRDGMVLPAKGPQAMQRGVKIVAAFGGADPSAAAAATAASDAAAAAAGIILPGRGGGGGGGRGRPGSGRGRGPAWGQQNGGEAAGEFGGEFGRDPEEADRIRRLRAKGRYMPY